MAPRKRNTTAALAADAKRAFGRIGPDGEPASTAAVTASTAAVTAAAGEMPVRQKGTLTWPERLSLPLSHEQMKLLKTARVDDGIDSSFRLRAMITVWSEDSQFRAQVNAQALRDRRLNREQNRRG